MKSADMTAAARERGSRKDYKKITRTATTSLYPGRRFVVRLRVWKRCREWARFQSREEAAAQVSKLRGFGFDAFLTDEREVQSS